VKKPNYSFEKLKKEQRRAKKSEEKRMRRMNKSNPQPEAGAEIPTVVFPPQTENKI
jgi:hypothetical protein